MSGQLRLETIYLTQEDADNCFTTKLSSFSKLVTYLSSALIIRYVVFRLGSYSTSIKISARATQAFVSLNRVLPA